MSERMRPLTTRRLTPGELALAEAEFGDALDPACVHVLCAPVPKLRPFVPGEVLWSGRYLVVWPAREAWRDFSNLRPGQVARFLHELVHVWQAQNGVDLL